jgi:hypothetical protein
LAALIGGCDGGIFGDDCDPEAEACEPANDDGGDCGFSGPACRQIVDCCNFVEQASPSSGAAESCTLDSQIASGHLNNGAGSHPDCAQMTGKAAYQAVCFACEP